MTGGVEVSALVLRKADYRDYDRMVTLLTRERGLVDAVARGCRRPKSELMNAAEPFVCGQYHLFSMHERYTIDQVKITEGFFELRSDYDRLMVGARWLKMLEKVCVHEQPNPGMFDMALTAITYLAHSDIETDLLDFMFLMKLCFFTGIPPCADKCCVCGKSAEEVTLRFSALRGGCVCVRCAENARVLSEGARRILMKAPRTPYKAVEKLVGHPDWPEAYARMQEYIKIQVFDE